MRRIALGVAGLLLVGAVVAKIGGDDEYKLVLLMPSAEGSFKHTKVMLNGFEIGMVESVGVEGNKAKVVVSIDKDQAPLHAGTTARISWYSVIGRRQIELVPGLAANPVLPSGKVISAVTERVELDDIAAALDAPTRAKVQGLLAQLQSTLGGSEGDINATVKAAGPTLNALGEIVKGIGQDGPAIKSLVTQLGDMAQTLAERDQKMAATIQNLRSAVQAAASEQEQVKAALGELPNLVRTGTDFFNDVPAAVDQTVPLLKDLRAATERLPAVAANLSPVLADLRPTVADLKPTLAAAQNLLGKTPGLLSTAHSTLPSLTSAMTTLQPAVDFLRPYTPELVGFLTNWTSLFSAKNSAGHFGRAMIPLSASMLNDNPGILPPGMTQSMEPKPGELAGQPWTDANGDEVR